MPEESFHHVTISCPGGGAGLLHELRHRATDHIRGRLRMTMHEGQRVIEMTVDDLDAVRGVVTRHAPDGTRVHVDVPGRRSAGPSVERPG